mmetsp:Transcript_18699/g.58734  ORF Transcript_18699/g.58734 Transcript_18699/m.58734 type:complete len:271 (-) Transcript_18699:202-1014(-)
MPWSSPRLHMLTTDSGCSRAVAGCTGFETGDATANQWTEDLAGWLSSAVPPAAPLQESLAVKRNLAAARTLSSVALRAKEMETTRPRPISPHLMVSSSINIRARVQRCTTTATPTGTMVGNGPSGNGAAVWPIALPPSRRGEESSSWRLAPARAPPLASASCLLCCRCTASARRRNSSVTSAGKSCVSADEGSSRPSAAIQISLAIRMRRTSLQRPCWNGRSRLNRRRKRHTTSLFSNASRTSRCRRRCRVASRSSRKAASHSLSHSAGG